MSHFINAPAIKADPSAAPMPAFTSIPGCHQRATEQTPASAARAMSTIRIGKA